MRISARPLALPVSSETQENTRVGCVPPNNTMLAIKLAYRIFEKSPGGGDISFGARYGVKHQGPANRPGMIASVKSDTQFSQSHQVPALSIEASPKKGSDPHGTRVQSSAAAMENFDVSFAGRRKRGPVQDGDSSTRPQVQRSVRDIPRLLFALFSRSTSRAVSCMASY